MEKKGHYYYNLLSDKNRELFKINFITDYKEVENTPEGDLDFPKHTNRTFNECMEDEFRNMDEFLSGAFLFDETPEGFEYWDGFTKIDIN